MSPAHSGRASPSSQLVMDAPTEPAPPAAAAALIAPAEQGPPPSPTATPVEAVDETLEAPHTPLEALDTGTLALFVNRQGTDADLRRAFAPLAAAKTPLEFAEAGRVLLWGLADAGAALEVRASTIWEYVKTRVWPAEPSSSAVAPAGLPTEEEYLRSLGREVREQIRRGTSTVQAQQSAINTIRKHWGPDWFDRVPPELLPSGSGADPLFLSKRLLQRIAELAKEVGDDAAGALQGCRAAIYQRTSARERRKSGRDHRAPRVPTLLPTDVDLFLAAVRSGGGDEFRDSVRRSGRRPQRAEAPPPATSTAASGPGEGSSRGTRGDSSRARGSGSGGEGGGDDEGGQRDGDDDDEDEDDEDDDDDGDPPAPRLARAGRGKRPAAADVGPPRPKRRRQNVQFFEGSLFRPVPLGEDQAEAWVTELGVLPGTCPAPALAKRVAMVLDRLWDNVDAILATAAYPEANASTCDSCVEALAPLRCATLERLTAVSRGGSGHAAADPIPPGEWPGVIREWGPGTADGGAAGPSDVAGHAAAE